MTRSTVVSSATALATGLFALPVFAQPVLFTGDVTADFAGADVHVVADPAGIDVGVPVQFPAGTISGNDIADIRLSYDAANDTLYVGFNTYGIGGDVDGDGDAGRTSATLGGIGGADLPDFGGTESFALLIDIDEDGVFDVIAGVSGMTDLGGFTVATFAGSPFAPGFAFGAPLPDHTGAVYGSPDADEPDVEFTIVRFSELLAVQGGVDASARFGINAFMGSFGDAGIGEDFTPGAGQALDICLTPDAPENTCDGFDNDCDGAIDEDVAGIGDACTVGTGACERPGQVVCGDGETICDGAPGAPSDEVCDAVDNDCDGATDEDVAPTPISCGTGACAADGERVCLGGQLVDDCTPGVASAEACDAVDNDCDGATDEGIAPVATDCGTGACADTGALTCQGGQLVDSCTPGAPADEVCDAADNDCDGATDEDIAAAPTTCGTGACAADGERSCVGGQFVDDCTPGVADAETCDAVDNDCDGAIDEGIAPVATDCGAGACAAHGELACQGGQLVDSCAPGAPAAEACDAVDNDCDGATDEGIAPQPTACGTGACADTGALTCQGGQFVDSCAPGAPADEACDGEDNDCDGATDEGGVCCVPGPEVCDGEDNDCDGATDEGIAPEMVHCGAGICTAKGLRSCVDGALVDDCTPGAPRAEACNAMDDDCDGATDEDLAPRPLSCGVGACAAEAEQVCESGKWVGACEPGEPDAEICNDVDDDCDGEVDESTQVYRITNFDGGRYGLMAWHFNDGGIFRWNMDEVFLTVREDGTATMEGRVSVAIIESGPGQLGEEWNLHMEFVYRGQGDAFGGPKIEDEDFQTPAVTAGWRYWDMTEGYMTRPGSLVKLEQRPRSGNYPFQLGISANGKDRELGVALWYYYIRYDDDGRMIASRGDMVAGAELVDEGCQPEPEVCDDVDNDLDGAVDEGFGVGEACTVGIGACEADGVLVCGPDGGSECVGQPGAPSDEVCNGIDDDCDGEADEGLDVIEMVECGVGACASMGKQTCYGGEIVSSCVPGEPAAEECNEIDDDCDGAVDEGLDGAAVYRATEYAAGGHAIWMPDFAERGRTRMHLRDDARLTINDDGTASLTGTAYVFDGPNPAGEEWTVDVNFAYRGQGDAFGGPKIERPGAQPPAITDLWHYFDLTDGTLTRPGSVVTLRQRPANGRYPMQLGDRANGKDNDLGLAVWFFWERRDDDGTRCDGHGDFNLDLESLGCGEFDPPLPEVCNGEDDDHDGAVDEGFGLGERCSVGIGACAADGEIVCGPDGDAVCDAEALPPVGEVCDAADNDCDGEIDEDLGTIPTVCGEGLCGARGEIGCVDGEMIDSCTPGDPVDEACNGEDDDCDGEIDEGTRIYQADEYAANGHAFDGHSFGRNGRRVRMHFEDDARLELYDDGTGRLTATAFVFDGDAPAGEVWDVEFELAYRGRGDAFGGPKLERPAIQPPEVYQVWDYYDMTSGTVSRPGSVATLTMRPADGRYPYQMGHAANNKDADFGASVWFHFHRVDDDGFESRGTGDFNIDLRHIGDTGCVGAPEVCNDEDDDLDGAVDEDFGLGGACTVGTGACAAEGAVVCGPDGGTTCDAAPGAPADEACDGVDNDCDGATDEGIAAVPSDCGVGACAAHGEVVCVDGALVDTCEPGAPADEICNAADDDCDGAADEDIAPEMTHCGQGLCAASGERLCVDGALVDTCEPTPGMPEICDGQDNDCDGGTDEEIAPVPTACGVGACGATGEMTCVDGALVDDCAPGAPNDETCDETDEDCDGEVDEGTTSREWAVSHFRRGHALWLPGFNRDGKTVIMRFRDDASFFWHVDGTASIIGTAYVHSLGGGPGQLGQEWHTEFYLRYRGQGDDFGGPKIERPDVQTPEVTAEWHYWDLIGARLTRPEEVVELTQAPADGRFPYQFGWLANGKTDTLGGAMWFDWHREQADGTVRSGHGDINVEMNHEAQLCAEPPIDPVCENTCRTEGDRHMQDCLNMGFPAENCEALLGDWLDQCIMLQCC